MERTAELARRYDAYLQISLEVFTRTGRLPDLRNQSILVDPSGASGSGCAARAVFPPPADAVALCARPPRLTRYAPSRTHDP